MKALYVECFCLSGAEDATNRCSHPFGPTEKVDLNHVHCRNSSATIFSTIPTLPSVGRLKIRLCRLRTKNRAARACQFHQSEKRGTGGDVHWRQYSCGPERIARLQEGTCEFLLTPYRVRRMLRLVLVFDYSKESNTRAETGPIGTVRTSPEFIPLLARAECLWCRQ